MLADFLLTVLYTQVVVHVPGLERPGLLWTDKHVDQGFAWSEGIASFGVPDHDGQVRVRVSSVEAYALGGDVLWAVQTPFDVPTAPLQIGTIANMRAVDVPAGRYDLVFEARDGSDEGEDVAFVLDLKFVPSDEPSFAILKQGEELATDEVLRRDAEHG